MTKGTRIVFDYYMVKSTLALTTYLSKAIPVTFVITTKSTSIFIVASSLKIWSPGGIQASDNRLYGARLVCASVSERETRAGCFLPDLC